MWDDRSQMQVGCFTGVSVSPTCANSDVVWKNSKSWEVLRKALRACPETLSFEVLLLILQNEGQRIVFEQKTSFTILLREP